MIRVLTAVTGLLALLYLAATGVLYARQRDILFRPEPLDWPPEALDLDGVAVHRIQTEDGEHLVAWYARGTGRRLILFLHGTGGSLTRRAERIRQLSAFGSVLAIDYRGFGGSSGTPSEAGLGRDAEAAYRFALGAGFTPGDIVVLGESLGSGLALRLAARHPVGGVVLAAAYASIRAVAAERYWMFPVAWTLKDPFDVAPDLRRVVAPILVLHGTDDRVVPLHHAETLVAGAGPNLTFVRVPAGSHMILSDPAGAESLALWLSRLPAAPPKAEAHSP